MKISVKNIIYQAILDNKWIEIDYVNKNKEETNYYIGIKDINPLNGRITCEIFNAYKNKMLENKNENNFIYASGIKSARQLDQSYFETPDSLIEKIHSDDILSMFLEVDKFDNDILRYLSDAYELDNDPYLRESIVLPGIDLRTLAAENKVKLSDENFSLLLNSVFKKNSSDSNRIFRKSDLAINSFSIDMNGKQYVVAYRSLYLNFKDKTLQLSPKSTINKSFLIEEDKKVTLGMYLDMSPEDFCASYDEKKRELIEELKLNFKNGEIINTRPTIFLISRNIQTGVDQAFEAISLMDSEHKVTAPIQSFFGRNRRRSEKEAEPNIVVFDKKKINIDQLRVVYNSMINPVTYVKGPPGTGKTETIFNVLLSSYANDKNVLVCSNNNHPVNDIFDKMTKSLVHKLPFTNKIEPIMFPIMRLGNNTEMIETIKKLRVILEFAQSHKDSKMKETMTEASKTKSLSGYKELRELLKKYENIQELHEKITKLNNLLSFTSTEKIKKEMYSQIELQNRKLNEFGSVNDDDVAKYTISASSDVNFQNYMYYSSLARMLKLLSPSYKDLRDIISIEDEVEAGIKLNKYIKDDANLKKFINIFPIIVCTNVSCEKLGSPKQHFDLCIMDEAGQCNVATSLIPIVRASNLLLVGDTNQLQPVTVIETDVNKALMERYHIKEEYNYVKNSILSTMLRKDNISKDILLRYHYRCGTRIAKFVNDRFYEKQLKLLNQNEGHLIYCDVKNKFDAENRNSYEQEAKAIVKIIKDNNYKDVGIVTPFVNQAALINKHLIKEGITDVKAGTIHTLQGSEKSTIIMSAALSLKTSQKTMDWIKNNHELINVAVTRAKHDLVFVGDREAINLLSKKDETVSDIKALSDYVYTHGTCIVPKSDATINVDFSNNSKNEKDFFETITPYFESRRTKFRIERNVPVKDAIAKILPEHEEIIGKKEFDVIVQVAGITNRYRTIIVFEIDGGEHIGSEKQAKYDRQKEQICGYYKVKLIRIANSQVKDYELIIRLFECMIKDIPDMESEYVQMSLFE